MKHKYGAKFIILLAFISVVTFLNSCVSLERTTYLQKAQLDSIAGKVYVNEMNTYTIQPGDNLYIDIKSLDPTNMSSLSGEQRDAYQLNSEMGVYLKSYQVNDSGFILFPVVGKIKASGLTVNEVRESMQEIMDDFYKMTTVTVKLVNFNVSILGEVNRPGTYTVYQEKLNIFQAISMGGDLTPFGNRKEVMLLRKTGNGGTEILKVNLLTDSLLEQPGFYLRPDDIIYIEPMKSKNFAFTSFPYSIVLSTITTTLLILNFFK